MSSPIVHRIETRGEYDLATTFWLLSMGSGDPCLRFDAPDQMRMTLQSPAGPAGFEVRHQGQQLLVNTFGEVADWLVPHLPELLGVNFDPPMIESPAKLKRIAKQYAGMRIARLPTVSLRLVQIILQQLISYRDACHGWRKLVQKYGTPVDAQADLFYPPTPEVLKALVPHQFIECGILPQHGRRITDTMRRAKKIETTWGEGSSSEAADELSNLLTKLPGIGPWTIGFLRGAGLGDADAIVPGDYSHPKHVAYFFGAHERDLPAATDEQMVELLEPYRPHRFYALALLLKGSPAPPRRGPKRRSLRERFR